MQFLLETPTDDWREIIRETIVLIVTKHQVFGYFSSFKVNNYRKIDQPRYLVLHCSRIHTWRFVWGRGRTRGNDS